MGRILSALPDHAIRPRNFDRRATTARTDSASHAAPMIRAHIAALSLAAVLCACAAPVVVPSPPSSAAEVTLYYKESHVEPWSASNSGDFPPGWLDKATLAIGSAGHPVNISQERTFPVETRTCFSSMCPNLHALKIVLPLDERAKALLRCFVADPLDNTPPAVNRQDCDPLYRPGG